MEYEIVELEEKRLEGIGIRTTNQEGKAIQDIAQVWQGFFAEGIYDKIENKANGKTIGLYTDYEGDFTKPYYFMAGCEVTARGTVPSHSKYNPKNHSKRQICQIYNNR